MRVARCASIARTRRIALRPSTCFTAARRTLRWPPQQSRSTRQMASPGDVVTSRRWLACRVTRSHRQGSARWAIHTAMRAMGSAS
eukprot:4029727-Prymnesium_polylepis.1